MNNIKVREQFNKQAENFSNWSVARNIEYLKAYLDFSEISIQDNLLDVACGPGEFTIYCADYVKEAFGIDISDREIKIATTNANRLKLKNITFICADVERMPLNDCSFSSVTCKSAFHHFIKPEIVIHEIKRCCKYGGKISVQDIIAYDDADVNIFFETIDKLIDISHNKVLDIKDFNLLFSNNQIQKVKDFRLYVDLNMNDYINHASQDKESKKKIKKLLNEGLKNKIISEYLYLKNGDLYFKRPVYLILGEKK